MIFFLHTPKCGGKSLRRGLKRAYHNNLIVFGGHALKPFPQPLLNLFHSRTTISKIHPSSLIYGHYSFSYFSSLINQPNTKLGMFFRHPLDLICSYYFYWVEKHPRNNHPSLINFVRHPNHRHFYKKLLGPISVDRLDYVGIFEDYQTSLQLFKPIFDKSIHQERFNRTQNKPSNYHSYLKRHRLLNLVQTAMSENLLYYKQARSRYRQLCRLHQLTPKLPRLTS